MTEESRKLDLTYKILKIKKLTWFQRIRHHCFRSKVEIFGVLFWNHTHIAQIQSHGKKLWVPIDPLDPHVNVDFIMAIWARFCEKTYHQEQATEAKQKQEEAVKDLLQVPSMEV